jgi:O-methyltransferase
MINFLKKVAKAALGRSVIVDIVPPVEFVGWKMATGTRVPWHGGGTNALAQAFSKCDQELAGCIATRKVILTQFRPKSVEAEVAQLRWRHYLVYWSATVASRITGGDQRNFVEMGVCDGLTAWYASQARQHLKCGGEFFLYDAWEEMRSDLLTASEGASAGSYSYLNVENTKRNLALCGKDIFVFNKGYVPESFSHSRNPESLAWIHIDLNSSIPTIASLDYFWDSLLPGGLVLLDDFAWPGYEDTRTEVEKWCERQGLDILQFPTGQALITKRD